MEIELPLNLLPRWSKDAYRMRAVQLELLSDTFNQLSNKLKKPVICIPYFMVKDQFDGKGTHFDAESLVSDSSLRATFFPSASAVKKVCICYIG